MRLKHAMLLSHGLFLSVAVAGILAFLAVTIHYGNLGRPWELLLWVGGGLLIFAGIWSIFEVAAAISGPLEHIAGASRAIAAGRFDVRAGRARYHEGTTLAASFNDMAEALGVFHAADVARLLSEQRRNEAVLDSIDDGIVILDEDARIERINPIAARQFGVDSAEVIGRRLDALLGRDDFDGYARRCIEHQNPGQRKPLEFSLGDGLYGRELSCSFAPFTDARPGLVLVVHDVTAERRFVRERNDFVMRASHELRTPLTGMRMAVNLLAEHARFTPESREADLMQTLSEETTRLTGLLQSLLDLSRLRGGASSTMEFCSPAPILRQALRRCALRAQTQGVELREEIAAGLPQVPLDSNECARVIDNLLDNALRHTPPGGRVILSAVPDHANGEMEICVADDGEGIARQQLERIFEPFVQVGSKPGGAGLGLTLCREIVERHGGRIYAESTPGVQTRFCIRMPLPSEIQSVT
ncbi:MAG: ATP-binding protein [Rhodanobacteraceae bacterium]